MTLLPKSFARPALVALAALSSAAAPGLASARGDAPFYTVELAEAASPRTVIAGGVAFTCNQTRCTAPKGSSRPVRVCRELNREVGQIAAFLAGGAPLGADKLAKCNR